MHPLAYQCNLVLGFITLLNTFAIGVGSLEITQFVVGQPGDAMFSNRRVQGVESTQLVLTLAGSICGLWLLGCQSMVGLTETQWVFRRMRVCYYLLNGLRLLCGLQTSILGFSAANIVLRPYTAVPFILLVNASVAMIGSVAGLCLLTSYLKKNKCTDLEKCLAAELEQMEYIRRTTTPITGPPTLKPSCPLPKPKRTYTPSYTLSSFRSASPYSSSTSTLSSFS
ncbi:hypothetical protein BDM02DRAFT_3183130 [Thelephora ganbajun]|uniref:Uncharacterized protein n=1 Tax=Thelephora ganbajun TaxID=370292 RepID=A0ACB6ZUV9_THEGA|nr:hypothetical protein BDM02DRAFT_3183130 [Thelephora ganbajun]